MLHTLKPNPGHKHRRRRVARGNSAGGGTTAGRGTKGQHARTGKGYRFGFEGGQVPLIRRQPKLGGFRNPNRMEYEVLNVDTLEGKLSPGSYDADALRGIGLLSSNKPVKLLGRGALTKKFELKIDAISGTAKQAVEKAGGKITLSHG